MKLSEAMRSNVVRETRERFFEYPISAHGDAEEDYSNTPPCAACAMGTAFIALMGGLAVSREIYSIKTTFDPQTEFTKVFPILSKRVQCPESKCWRVGEDSLYHIITHLHIGNHGDNKWNREQIADWIETIEKEEEAKNETL